MVVMLLLWSQVLLMYLAMATNLALDPVQIVCDAGEASGNIGLTTIGWPETGYAHHYLSVLENEWTARVTSAHCLILQALGTDHSRRDHIVQ